MLQNFPAKVPGSEKGAPHKYLKQFLYLEILRHRNSLYQNLIFRHQRNLIKGLNSILPSPIPPPSNPARSFIKRLLPDDLQSLNYQT